MVKRIMIIGSPGSGKSTLAPQLARQFDVPLFHLDKLNWLDNHRTVSEDIFLARLKEKISQDKWLIDGNYENSLSLRLERADLVVWLQVPRYICMYRIMKRYLKSLVRENKVGNPKRLDWEFIKFVWYFPSKQEEMKLLITSYQHIELWEIKSENELWLKIFQISCQN